MPFGLGDGPTPCWVTAISGTPRRASASSPAATLRDGHDALLRRGVGSVRCGNRARRSHRGTAAGDHVVTANGVTAGSRARPIRLPGSSPAHAYTSPSDLRNVPLGRSRVSVHQRGLHGGPTRLGGFRKL